MTGCGRKTGYGAFGYALVVCLLAMSAAGCSQRVPPQVTPASSQPFSGIEVVGELKAFAEAMGGQPTENFLSYSPRLVADERCYFTGKLQLPEYYSHLRLVRENEARCTARADEFDVFFYPVQAVASGEETITVALAEAPTERLLVVVPHEDFHNQSEARKAPTEVAESAATLVGFLTASDFAKQRFGEDSLTSRMLARDVELFLQKSSIVNVYYDKMSDVYKSFRTGALTQEQAFRRKSELFAELQQSCSAISPDPVSFNKCPAAMNNAGLAFDRTYTRHYPLMHQLYTSLGGDTSALVVTLKRLMTRWPSSVTSVADLLRANP
jgi:putative aminopeptidase